LMGRAAALGGYRVGAPLPFEDLWFARSQFRGAVRGGVVGAGEPGVAGGGPAAIAEVERSCRTSATRRPVSIDESLSASSSASTELPRARP